VPVVFLSFMSGSTVYGGNVKVWYKLFGAKQPTKVCVDANSDIDDLKKIIKSNHSVSLSHCDASRLLVFPHMRADIRNRSSNGTIYNSISIRQKDISDRDKTEVLDPGEAIPTTTTSKEPLIVKVPLSVTKSPATRAQPISNDQNLLHIQTRPIVQAQGQNHIGDSGLAVAAETTKPVQWEGTKSVPNLSEDEVHPIVLDNLKMGNHADDGKKQNNDCNVTHKLSRGPNNKRKLKKKVKKNEMNVASVALGDNESKDANTVVAKIPSSMRDASPEKHNKRQRRNQEKREAEVAMDMATKKLAFLAVKRSRYLGGDDDRENYTGIAQKISAVSNNSSRKQKKEVKNKKESDKVVISSEEVVSTRLERVTKSIRGNKVNIGGTVVVKKPSTMPNKDLRQINITKIKHENKEMKTGTTSDCISFSGVAMGKTRFTGDKKNDGGTPETDKPPAKRNINMRKTKKKQEKKEIQKETLETEDISYVHLPRQRSSDKGNDGDNVSKNSDRNNRKMQKDKKKKDNIALSIGKKWQGKTVAFLEPNMLSRNIGAGPIADAEMSTPLQKQRETINSISTPKCLLLVDAKDKSTKKRANEKKIEQEYVDEVLRRAMREFIARIPTEACGVSSNVNINNRRVGNVIIKKDCVCHICHHTRPLCCQFMCKMRLHVYCDKHCLSQLELNLLSPGSTLGFCPICCLQCTCKKCRRQATTVAHLFKNQCFEQGLGLQETDMKVLPFCSAKLSTAHINNASNSDKGNTCITQTARKSHMSEYILKSSTQKKSLRKSALSLNFTRRLDTDSTIIHKIKGVPSVLKKKERKVMSDFPTISYKQDDGNIDYCLICEQSGKLICCDKCPRGFHDICLNISGKILSDSWKCPHCTTDEMVQDGDYKAGVSFLNKIYKAFRCMDRGCDDKFSEKVLLLSKIYEILLYLMDFDFGYVFSKPVNYIVHPDYLDVVVKPIDLGTISTSLLNGTYCTVSTHAKGKSSLNYSNITQMDMIILKVLKDIESVWHNCFLYNLKGTAVYRMAEIQQKRCHIVQKCSIDKFLHPFVQYELKKSTNEVSITKESKVKCKKKNRNSVYPSIDDLPVPSASKLQNKNLTSMMSTKKMKCVNEGSLKKNKCIQLDLELGNTFTEKLSGTSNNPLLASYSKCYELVDNISTNDRSNEGNSKVTYRSYNVEQSNCYNNNITSYNKKEDPVDHGKVKNVASLHKICMMGCLKSRPTPIYDGDDEFLL